MAKRIVHCLIFVQLGFVLCSSGLSVSQKETTGLNRVPYHLKRQLLFSASISTRQMDITTPITTVPTLNPTTTTPVVNPAVSNPDSPPIADPVMNPTSTTSPVTSSGSWCVASQSASPTALQVALDYACGYGGAECSAIQPGGSCYNPITVRDHSSYAFNSYYQKNPVPSSCNFGGTAVTTRLTPVRVHVNIHPLAQAHQF